MSTDQKEAIKTINLSELKVGDTFVLVTRNSRYVFTVLEASSAPDQLPKLSVTGGKDFFESTEVKTLGDLHSKHVKQGAVSVGRRVCITVEGKADVLISLVQSIELGRA